MPSDSEIASATLTEEFTLRFPSFKSEDAVTLGLILRKRFRGSLRHAKVSAGSVSDKVFILMLFDARLRARDLLYLSRLWPDIRYLRALLEKEATLA